MRLRYLSVAELIETLYRALADNSVGKIIDSLLRSALVIVDELGLALLDDHGTQPLFHFVQQHMNVAPSECIALTLRAVGGSY